jgi:hypothetical protein
VDGALTCIAPIRPLQLCADGVYQPSLGVLGVPLIMVPDSSPRASKGVLVLAWRLCRTFLQGDRPFTVTFCSGGCARAHPPGLVVPSCDLIVARVHGQVPSSRAGLLTLSTVWPESGLREQPPSLCTEREDGQGLTRLLSYAPSSPFRKEEGGKRHVALGGR